MPNPNILLSPNFRLNADYMIYAPAVDSSGDVYHMAAYCILCLHNGWAIPKLYISHDTDDTLYQATSRAQNFLQLLFNGNIVPTLIDGRGANSYQYKPRNAHLRQTLLNQPSGITNYAVNQKITTALIQLAMIKDGIGPTTNVIRNKLLDFEVIRPVAANLQTWLQSKQSAIESYVRGQKFVILHDRSSTGTNDGQNLSPEEITHIKFILTGLRVSVFTFRVTNRLEPIAPDTVNVFENKAGIPEAYDKFCHIHLLNAAACMPGFMGIIGGTSGTLDVAAFMGIKVLNIHKVAPTAARVLITPHQDFRIILQAYFMSICSEVNSDIIAFWLNRGFDEPYLFNYSARPLGLEDGYDDHFDRSPFHRIHQKDVRGRESLITINPWYKSQKYLISRQILAGRHFYEHATIVNDEVTERSVLQQMIFDDKLQILRGSTNAARRETRGEALQGFVMYYLQFTEGLKNLILKQENLEFAWLTFIYGYGNLLNQVNQTKAIIEGKKQQELASGLQQILLSATIKARCNIVGEESARRTMLEFEFDGEDRLKGLPSSWGLLRIVRANAAPAIATETESNQTRQRLS